MRYGTHGWRQEKAAATHCGPQRILSPTLENASIYSTLRLSAGRTPEQQELWHRFMTQENSSSSTPHLNPRSPELRVHLPGHSRCNGHRMDGMSLAPEVCQAIEALIGKAEKGSSVTSVARLVAFLEKHRLAHQQKIQSRRIVCHPQNWDGFACSGNDVHTLLHGILAVGCNDACEAALR